MECWLDQVFDQLSTKFEDYLASNAITGTAHHTTIDSDPIQHQHRHEPDFQAYSHTQYQANTDHLINSKFPVDVEQSQNGGYRGVDQVNPCGIDSSISLQITYNQAQYSTSLSVPLINTELLNQNDANEKYGLDVGDDQLQVHDIDNNEAQKDSDEPEIKTKFDDSNNELITTEQMSQMSSSLSAPHTNELLNYNSTNEVEDEDDCDCDDCRNGIEVKEEEEGYME